MESAGKFFGETRKLTLPNNTRASISDLIIFDKTQDYYQSFYLSKILSGL